MNNPKNELDMGFTDERFPKGAHACLIYDREEERVEIVARYMATGLKRGEQIRYLIDTSTPETIQSWLIEMGIDLPEVLGSGALSIAPAQSAYYPGGEFSPSKYLEKMPPRFAQSKQAGYSGMRTSSEMSWALHGVPGSDRLIEYEALLNTVVTDFPFSGMCQYDARRFDGATLFKVLKVHPWMVVRGAIVQNPYYISPQEYLQEIKSNS
jgi:hypothetical protein